MQSVTSNTILNPSFRISMPLVPSTSPRNLQIQPTIINTVSNGPIINDLFTPDVSDSSMIQESIQKPAFFPAPVISSNNNKNRLLPSKSSAQNPSIFGNSDYDNFPLHHPPHQFNHHIPEFSHDYDFPNNHHHFNGQW